MYKNISKTFYASTSESLLCNSLTTTTDLDSGGNRSVKGRWAGSPPEETPISSEAGAFDRLRGGDGDCDRIGVNPMLGKKSRRWMREGVWSVALTLTAHWSCV